MPKSILKGNRSSIPDDFRRINTDDFLRGLTPKKKKRKTLILPNSSPSQLVEKMSQLATPKDRNFQANDDSHWAIKKSALTYKASRRIKALAKPKTVSPKLSDVSGSLITPISSVTPSALSYIPTRRILELARPKDWIFYEHYI
ncbi:hypothetical protein JTB14_001092 [Gonioctena quinquepunctata]|nr:hypothetical protein JTB14_001092 [Gonioctena quinquepunctata]